MLSKTRFSMEIQDIKTKRILIETSTFFNWKKKIERKRKWNLLNVVLNWKSVYDVDWCFSKWFFAFSVEKANSFRCLWSLYCCLPEYFYFPIQLFLLRFISVSSIDSMNSTISHFSWVKIWFHICFCLLLSWFTYSTRIYCLFTFFDNVSFFDFEIQWYWFQNSHFLFQITSTINLYFPPSLS